MPSFARISLLAALFALAVPAVAAADPPPVSTSDAFVAAAQSANTGETIHVLPGVYTANVVVKNAGVTIDGPGAILVNKDTTTPTLTFSATSGAPDVVTGLFVINTAPAPDTAHLGQPAVQVGATGLTLQRALALSAAGDAVSSGATSGNPTRPVVIDSSMIFATGKGAAAIRATSSGVGIGDTTITAHHVTLLGTSTVVLDSSGSNGTPAIPPLPSAPPGNISAAFADSILMGKAVAPVANTTPGTGNTATLTAPTSGDHPNLVASDFSTAGMLFANPAKGNYHLRADSPVIGKGGPAKDESPTDIDGDTIRATGASDLGADQFVNRAPTAALAAVTGTVRQNQAITFDASKSNDPEAASGGGITAYHWDFGDGQTATTTTPTTTHAYPTRASFGVTVTVTDRQGLSSKPSAPASFTVIDGVPPTLGVGVPRSHQRIRAYRTKKVKGHTVKTNRRRSVVFFGGASDDIALDKVLIALRPLALKGTQCRWFDGKKSLKAGSCAAPIVLTPSTIGGGWRYAVPLKWKLPRGTYQLTAIALDASGLASAPKVINFRLR